MNLLHPDARVIDAATGETLTRTHIDAETATIGDGVVFLPMPTTVPAIARYLGALRLGRPVVLLDPDQEHTRISGELDDLGRPAPQWSITAGTSSRLAPISAPGDRPQD